MINPTSLEAMYDELVKEGFLGGVASNLASTASRKLTEAGAGSALRTAGSAAGRYLAQSAGNIGAGMGVGGAAGGLIGAAHGGYKGYQQAKEEGEAGLGAAMRAATGGLSGGARGAAVGTAVGGLAGLASGGRGSDAVAKLTSGKWNPLGYAARSGQQKLHSVTGLVPGGAKRGTEEYVKALTNINAGGLGSAAKAIQAAENPKRTLMQRIRGIQVEANPEAIEKAKQTYQRLSQSAQEGQTSLVGLAQNLQQKGLREGGANIIRHGAGSQWKSQGALGRAAMVGVPLGGAIYAGVRGGDGDPNDPSSQGRMERSLGALGGSALGMAAPMVGSTGGSLIQRAGTTAGGKIGRGIDKLVGAVRRPRTNSLGTAATGAAPGLDSPPVERVYSNAALGRPPEDMQV